MRIFLLLLAVGLSGCSAYSEVKTLFVITNYDPDRQIFYANGVEMVTIAGKTTEQFEAEIPVPKNPVSFGGYYPSGPSQVDKITNVTVTFKNARTGTLARQTTCYGGAKVKVVVSLRIQSGSEPYSQCDY